MIRSYKYPLHLTQAQVAVLRLWLWACCDLYNGALQERRSAYRQQGRTVTLYDQIKALTEIRHADVAWSDIPVEVSRSALCRLDKAYNAFFRRVKNGAVRAGFPRFRSKRQYDSFSFGVGAARKHHIGTLIVGNRAGPASAVVRLRVPVHTELRSFTYLSDDVESGAFQATSGSGVSLFSTTTTTTR